MKYFTLVLLIFLGFSACSSHKGYTDKGYYDRAIRASDKALDKLDRE